MCETTVDCMTCLDTGYVCQVCEAADDECMCEDGPELVPCSDCSHNYLYDDRDDPPDWLD